MAEKAANHHLRRALALAITAAAMLSLPASANAAFAKLDSAGKVVYTAALGEANDVTATYTSGGGAKLSEAGHFGPFPILIAGSNGCSGLSALIGCGGASGFDLRTGDGDDKVAARNGGADKISCGSGTDSVSADSQDTVSSDCESVDRGATVAPATPTGTNAPPTGGTSDPPVGGDSGHSGLNEADPTVNIAPPVIPSQTVKVSPSGVAAVQVVCPVDAGTCRGTVALVLARPGAHVKHRIVAAATKSGITLGSAKFTAKAGTKPFVQVRLNRRGRRRIVRTRHTRCKIVVTTRSADGKVVTTSRSITVRPRRTLGRVRKSR
jgi:hypothetical protein